MASAQEMFAFVTQFGPMLGEIAARVDFLERRIEELENGGVASPGGTAAPGADELGEGGDFELFGEKISMKDMLEKSMGGASGLAGLKEKVMNWRPGKKPDAAVASAETPPTEPNNAATPPTETKEG